jgi:hypothetical protein
MVRSAFQMISFAFRCGADARHVYFVLLHTAELPDANLWSQYVDAVGAAILHSRTAVNVFAVTDGGGPDSGQRRALAEAFARDQHGAMTHVFTTSTFTRGIVTAFRWIARARAEAYLPVEFPTVCKRCGVPAQAVLEDLRLLQKHMPPVALLAQLEDATHGASSRTP